MGCRARCRRSWRRRRRSTRAEQGNKLRLIVGAVFLIVLAIGGYVYLKIETSAQRERAINRAREKMRELTTKHLDTLARKRMMLLRADEYGVVDTKAWKSEMQRFVDTVVRPALIDFQAETIAPTLSAMATEIIEGAVREKAARITALVDYDDKMSPIEYEYYCASLLNKAG